MITDSVLLQANATIIAGILIFLAIAPYAAADIIRLERRRRISILYTIIWESEDDHNITFTYYQPFHLVNRFSNALKNLGVGLWIRCYAGLFRGEGYLDITTVNRHVFYIIVVL